MWTTALSDSQIYTRSNQQEYGCLHSGYCQILHGGYGTAGAAVLITRGWGDAIVGWNVKAWLTVAGIQYLRYSLLCLKFCNSHCLSTLFAAYIQHLESDKETRVIEKILPARFWKRKDAATPIEKKTVLKN